MSLNKKALLVGLNYTSTPQIQLRGCINDVVHISEVLMDGFDYDRSNIIQLRDDIKAEEVIGIKGLQDFNLAWETESNQSKESFVLEPLSKANKSYQDYFESLEPDMQLFIKKSWQEIHKKEQIQLGDYGNPLDTPKTFPVSSEKLEAWSKWGAQILTFEKDLKILGCL
jgi:predicted RNA-binding protein with RPS1 domain